MPESLIEQLLKIVAEGKKEADISRGKRSANRRTNFHA